MGWVAMLVGVSWTGGGTLLGVQALEISVVCFTSFQDGRGLELDFGWGGVKWLHWGLGTWQPASHSRKLLLVSHRQKKKSGPGHWPAI